MTARAGPALSRLLGRSLPASMNFGLERIRALLEAAWNPERSFRAIHVAGTNGKGSVAVTADAILRAGGLRTGLYTSPHLVDFAERIVIDGRPADAALLESVAADLLPIVERVDSTYFESVTALAFAAFARSGVRAAVVEVGLGGRLDATNTIAADVAVVTSIALDHADYLGSDLAGIAREKAGIIAPGASVVMGDIEGAERREILTAAERAGATVESFGDAFEIEDLVETADGVEFGYRSTRRGAAGDQAGAAEPLRIASPLRGRHQAVNVAVAIAAVDAFTSRGPRAGLLDAEVVAAGVASVRWPGRMQVVRPATGAVPGGVGPTRVYDIAHNPAAARTLADLLGRALDRGDLPRPLVLVAAVLGDKDWRNVIGPLLDIADHAVLTDTPSAPPDRRWDLEAAATLLSQRAAVAAEPDLDRALERAAEMAGNGTVLVTGSSYTVGDALSLEAERAATTAHDSGVAGGERADR